MDRVSPRVLAAVPQFAVADVVRTAEYAYFHVTGVDALAAAWRARGAEILDGPDDMVYGQREVVIRDPNGLVLAFGEELPLSR